MLVKVEVRWTVKGIYRAKSSTIAHTTAVFNTLVIVLLEIAIRGWLASKGNDFRG